MAERAAPDIGSISPSPASLVGSQWCLTIHHWGLELRTTPSWSVAWHHVSVSCQTHYWQTPITFLRLFVSRSILDIIVIWPFCSDKTSFALLLRFLNFKNNQYLDIAEKERYLHLTVLVLIRNLQTSAGKLKRDYSILGQQHSEPPKRHIFTRENECIGMLSKSSELNMAENLRDYRQNLRTFTKHIGKYFKIKVFHGGIHLSKKSKS